MNRRPTKVHVLVNSSRGLYHNLGAEFRTVLAQARRAALPYAKPEVVVKKSRHHAAVASLVAEARA